MDKPQLQQPQLQATFTFRFLRLPSDEMKADAELRMSQVCQEMTKASQAGRLGPILKIEGGIIIGELTGYIGVGPDPKSVIPVRGTLAN